MKTAETRLRQLIREIFKHDWPVPAEDRGGPMGNYAFVDNRAENWWKLPPEANTPAEEELYQALLKHIDKNTGISAPTAEAITQLLQTGLYSDVIKPPGEGLIYRGLTLPRDLVESWVQIPDDPKLQRKIKYGFIDLPADFTLSPARGQPASSWTTRHEYAMQFAMRYAPGQDFNQLYSVVLIASPADNPGVLLDLSGLYTLNPTLYHYRTEAEILGLGPIRVSGIRVQHKQDPCVDAWGNKIC
jgi:hypothetical protein